MRLMRPQYGPTYADMALDALAAYRLTRLITEDRITETPRDALRQHGGWLGELVSCPWCIGVWAAGGVILARRLAPRVWEPAAEVLAVAAVVGLLADWA